MQSRRIARVALFGVIICCGRVNAGTEQLALTSQIMYSTILVGVQDPITAKVFNTAPVGSDAGNFNLTATFPNGSATNTGTKPADGGTGNISYPFTYDSTGATPGPNTVSVTLTDTANNSSITQSGTVTVLSRVKPGFLIGGQVVTLSSVKPDFTEPPSVSPEQASATGGSSFAAAAPAMLGDPPPSVPTDEMDLDSITAIGDPEITLSLQPFLDLPPDDPADSPSDFIDIDGSVPGIYHTSFELNYSDEQDLPGAAAPGSEHAFFDVIATVTGTGNDATATVSIIVPEPASATLLGIGGVMALTRRRRRR